MRQEIDFDPGPVKGLVTGRRVLVTGAGGSIGSELCRQLAELSPAALVMLDRYENGLHAAMTRVADRPFVSPVVGDITDAKRLRAVFGEVRPHLVFHAAAHKHVPLMEGNPCEAVKNNVTGTRFVAEAAERVKAERFVLISTDKAVRPSSVMGATKRVAELLMSQMTERSRTAFVTVRFGNVLGSNGSVLPLFLEQINNGGPVTVTHPEMRRYFMLLSEAVHLVLRAAAFDPSPRVCVLDLGDQVRVPDLARNLIRLAGFVPEKEIPIVFTGLRPGEKLSEELVDRDEEEQASPVQGIFACTPPRPGATAGIRLKPQEPRSPGSERRRAGCRLRALRSCPRIHSRRPVGGEFATRSPPGGLSHCGRPMTTYLHLLGSAVLLMLVFWGIELRLPAEKQPLAGRIFNFVYYPFVLAWLLLLQTLLAPAYTRILMLAGGGLLPRLAVPQTRFAGQVIFAVVFAIVWDVWRSWVHRWQHASGLLWQTHKLHHDDHAVNSSSQTRQHLLNYVLLNVLYLPVVAIFGSLAPHAVAAFIMFRLWGFFIHMNVGIGLGPLAPIISGPQWHRIHHSMRPEHADKNFATFFPFIDKIFGTYYRPSPGEFPPTGLISEDSESVFRAATIGPFVALFQGLKSSTPLPFPVDEEEECRSKPTAATRAPGFPRGAP